MSGESVMPLPPDVREQVDGLASDYEMVAKSISHTQVAQNPVDGVPGWIGEAADAYTSSIQKLGSHTRQLPGIFASAVGVLNDWSAAVGAMITVIVPDLWDRYDQADRDYKNGIAALQEQITTIRQQGMEPPEVEIIAERDRLAENLHSAQESILAAYRQAMEGLDQHAQDAANSLKSIQDSVVEPSKQGTRNSVGTTLFNDIPLLDGQAEWEHAQEIAPGMADAMRDKELTEEELRSFNEKYGDYLSNPLRLIHGV